jgi:hypothetical protein
MGFGTSMGCRFSMHGACRPLRAMRVDPPGFPSDAALDRARKPPRAVRAPPGPVVFRARRRVAVAERERDPPNETSAVGVWRTGHSPTTIETTRPGPDSARRAAPTSHRVCWSGLCYVRGAQPHANRLRLRSPVRCLRAPSLHRAPLSPEPTVAAPRRVSASPSPSPSRRAPMRRRTTQTTPTPGTTASSPRGAPAARPACRPPRRPRRPAHRRRRRPHRRPPPRVPRRRRPPRRVIRAGGASVQRTRTSTR